MSSWQRWLPGAGAFAAGHRGLGTAVAVLVASQILLWIWRVPRLAPALVSGPLDLAMAAWLSLLLLVGGWLMGARQARGKEPATNPGPWQQAWQRLTARRSSRLGLGAMGTLVLVSLLAPAAVPHDPNLIGDGIISQSLPPLTRLHIIKKRDGSIVAAQDVDLTGDRVRLRQGPRWTEMPRMELTGTRPEDWHTTRLHLLGTDHLGRDLLSRILIGSRVSLGVGALAALLAVTLGAIIGAIAGWSGPRFSGALMRFTDAAMSFPRLFLILTVLTVVPGSFLAIVVVLGVTGWMGPCRLVRAQVLSLREREFVEAARAVGRRGAGIIWKHLLPNALAPLIVATTLRVGDTILLEAGLSFLGLGVPPPHATWGNLISGGRPALVDAWWIATFPGLALVLTVIALNLLGDGLREALDPRGGPS